MIRYASKAAMQTEKCNKDMQQCDSLMSHIMYGLWVC